MTRPDSSQPVSMALLVKALEMTMGQAREAAYRDAVLIMRETDASRQATEDKRSQRRNRNRVLMILVAWAASISVPYLAVHVLHIPALAPYAAGIGFTGDVFVTSWAWIRKY